ncbi:hypothetical protein LJB63_22745, partial [[Eubacterium] rectale]|nr:hypothetical protein [Agathobacter rectalis]
RKGVESNENPASWQYFSPASNRVKVVSATDGQSGEKKRPLPFPETVRTPRARPFQKKLRPVRSGRSSA